MAAQQHGSTAAWQHGSMAARRHGSTATRQHRRTDVICLPQIDQFQKHAPKATNNSHILLVLHFEQTKPFCFNCFRPGNRKWKQSERVKDGESGGYR
jgi:hypothetical protein